MQSFLFRAVPAAVVAGLLLASTVASPVDAKKKHVDLVATLTGENELNDLGEPNQGDLDGTGEAHVTLKEKQGKICARISVEDILLPASAAHIHKGDADETGPIVVTLQAPKKGGNGNGCFKGIDPDLIAEIAANPGDFYVNVHNTEFPAGALRGQLELD